MGVNAAPYAAPGAGNDTFAQSSYPEGPMELHSLLK